MGITLLILFIGSILPIIISYILHIILLLTASREFKFNLDFQDSFYGLSYPLMGYGYIIIVVLEYITYKRDKNKY